MLKLYKLDSEIKQYWETWDNGDGSYVVHWGDLGTKGETKEINTRGGKSPEQQIQEQIDEIIPLGFKPAEEEHTILIEYIVDGMGSTDDVDKRHKLEDRMNETLGWTGLGNCDGGSIGNGTMEVCCYVVDFKLAKSVIERDLVETEFSDYSRIYSEDVE